MINVLVTGKDGQLGQSIKNLISNYNSINFIFKSYSDLDITDEERVNAVFKSIPELNYCINCAAYTAVDKAEEEVILSHRINFLGVENLANACYKNKVTLIHVSTDFVFDGKALQPYLEDDYKNPLNEYGKSKLKGEQAVIEILHNYFIIRTSWLYSEYGNNFLKTMLRLSKERDELSVVSDQIGSPTYTKDLVEIILKLIEAKNTSYGIYHYSNEGITSWHDFAKEIFEYSNHKIILNKILTKDYPTAAIRPKYSVLNTSKIKNELGIEIPNWKRSLKACITKIKENKL